MISFSRAIVAALASVAMLASGAAAYANPGACSGQCEAHDPSVIQRASDGVYFRFNTGNRITVWKSNSLEGPWENKGAALPRGSSINLPGNQDLWAPDVQKVGDQYIMYYTVSSFGVQNSAIGYATSPTMEVGTWTDHGATGISSKKGDTFNAIDANLVRAGNGYVMNFGSFWGDIHQVPMSNDGTKAASGVAYKQIAFQPAGTHPQEGSFVYPRDGYYYLFWSEGICCGFDKTKPARGAEYKIRVCRSQNVAGPYVDKAGASCTAGGGTTVLESHGFVYGPGGQGVFNDRTHGTVLYYHYANTNVGLADSQYQFGWNTLNWSGGWPSV